MCKNTWLCVCEFEGCLICVYKIVLRNLGINLSLCTKEIIRTIKRSKNHDWSRCFPSVLPVVFHRSREQRYVINLTMYTHSPYSREEAACWNVASCSWEGGDTGWVHTSAPGCRGQDASSLGSLVFVSLATGLSYPLPTPILLPSPNCRASSSENSLFRRTLLVVSSLIVSRLHWIFCKERKTCWL